MATAQKIVPKEVKIEGESAAVTIDKVVAAADAHVIEHSADQTDLWAHPERDPIHTENARANRKKLTFSSVVGDSGIELVNTLVSERTETNFKELRAKAKEVKLAYAAVTKHYIQCSNLCEFYDFKDKDNNWVFCRLQRCHNAKEHSNSLKVYKKKNDAQVVIFDGPIYVSHKDVYNFASNINAVTVGQWMFATRVEKDGNKYTLKHEIYNLIDETKEVMSEASFELPDKVTCDVIKYIMKREFSAPITFLEKDQAIDFVRGFDVVLILRNDGANNNETFGFEIRSAMDLNVIKFARDKSAWIDIGGRKNWRKYAFPCFKFTVEEAQEEIGLS